MSIPLSDVNLLAVLVGAIAAMITGMIWYNPKVCGSYWMELVGKDEEDLENTDMKRAFGIGFTATLITTFFLAVILLMVGAATLGDAAKTALLVWLCAQLPLELHGVAWEERPMELLFINAGHALIALIVAAVVVQWFSSLVT